MAFVQAPGSIASLLLDCQQTLANLFATLQELPHDCLDALELQRCRDEIGRLSMWDIDTSASEGELDYALRKSSRLRDGVLELLRELAELSAGAILLCSGTDTNVSRDATEAHAIPSAERDISNSSEPDSLLSSSSTGVGSPLHQNITEIHDIITCLLKQGPVLQDPTPHDTRVQISHQGANLFDRSHVQSTFPRADLELIERLGTANWKRRRQLIYLRVRKEEEVHGSNFKNAPLLDGEQERDLISEADVSMYSYGMRQGSQATGDWTASSAMASSVQTPMTSLMEAPSQKPSAPSHHTTGIKARRLKLPRLPEPNSSLCGRQFTCPYCLHELVEIISLSSWKEHVMRDLEPYMCTFTGCIRPSKTYGIKGDWIQHEINVHQTQKTWFCRPCMTEFPSRALFDAHMRQRHSGLIREHQLESFAEMCEQSSGKIQSRVKCPLCLAECRSDKKLRKHLANHLEQIALFAGLPAQSQADSDDDLDLMEDSGSDGEMRAESVMLDIPEDTRTGDEARRATVSKYLGDQANSKLDETAPPSLEGHAMSRRSTVQFPVLAIGHPPNEAFYGRDRDILFLHESISNQGEMCVVHGVGGVGKTLTAVEYAYRYKEAYDCIFWLQADTAPGLAESYCDIAHSLGLVQGHEDQGQIIELSREWLECTKRQWILIFDNVEDWELLLQYLPRNFYSSHGSAIVTTQESAFISKVNHNLQLEAFGVEDGSAMLLQYLDRPDPKNDPEQGLAQEISGLVGGLPVAISHVAGYVAYSQCSLFELLEIFKQRRRHTGAAINEDDDLPASFRQASFSYDDTLAMVWNITLRELSADARDLTYILAYLNCEAVPEYMLCAVHPEHILEFLDSRESIRYKRMKHSPVKRRLIQAKDIEGESCLSLHRSLQRSIRDTAAENSIKRQEVFEQALLILRKVFPAISPIQVPEPQTWREHQRLLPHVISLQSAFVEAKSAIRGSKKFAGLLSDAGMNQWERGFTRDGLLLLKTSEQVLDSLSSEDSDIMRADINAMIALLHDNTGISTRSEGLRRREYALSIRKEQTAKLTRIGLTDDILLHNAWMDYAISLLQYNRYEEAEPIVHNCLEKYREWGPPEAFPFEYAKYYHKIGLIRMYQEKYAEALEAARLGAQYMMNAGNESLSLRYKFDLACIHLQSGDINKAFELHKEILEKRKTICGKMNENTLESHYAVGVLHEIRGDFAEAEHSFCYALDHRRVAYWSTEAIARAQYHLAICLRAQKKDLDKATRNYDEAKATLSRLLPLDYPETLKDVQDEAVLFDHLLTVYGARFTGRGLLSYIR